MNIFNFNSYKSFLTKKIQSLPGHGRGELSKIAKHLKVHTTMMSHILKGDAHFSMEQSLALADYLTLSDLETEFLIALVQLERAGDQRTKLFFRNKIKEIKARALNLKERFSIENELSEADRALFYSSRVYAQIRLLTAVKRFQTFEALVSEVDLPAKTVRTALDFLISRGLCTETKGKIVYAVKKTYLDAGSPLAIRHHTNWREQAIRSYEHLREEDLAFTYPTVISEEDFLKIREQLVAFIEEFKKDTLPSPSDHLYCLNIDWLKLSKG